MNETMIGWKVELKTPMLGNPAGAIGFVFNEYPDFDDNSKLGVQVIFENGNFDGFSVEEQGAFLVMHHPVLDYAGYQFANVMLVDRDFRSGYWDFARK